MHKLIIVLIILLSPLSQVFAQVNIWEGTSIHRRVEMTIYRSNHKSQNSNLKTQTNSPAIIVCPGGSYYWHDMENEGRLVGEWLQTNGITAFVLRYRTAYVPAFITHYRLILRGKRYPDALDDLRQTLRIIRNKAKAEEYGVDTTMIGVMGFSAGGHLAMSSAELLPKAEYPAFIAALYPVVTMSQPCVHKRSRRGLLGDSREHNHKLCDSLSMEKHVPDDCPPVFLVNCADDPVVDKHNSELLDSALTEKRIPHKYIQYKTGGHGFGASDKKGTEECRAWRNEFLNWFRHLR